MINIHSPITKRERVVQVVSEYYKVDPFENTRKREVVFARHVCGYLLWNFCEMGTVDIGKLFHRDHSSVVAGNRVVRNLCESSPETRNQIIEIETQLE